MRMCSAAGAPCTPLVRSFVASGLPSCAITRLQARACRESFLNSLQPAWLDSQRPSAPRLHRHLNLLGCLADYLLRCPVRAFLSWPTAPFFWS